MAPYYLPVVITLRLMQQDNMVNKIKRCKNFFGYTIIEAMVVVLVVGILATLAVGGYKKYMAKTLVEQAIAAALPLQQAIQDFFQQQGFLPGYSDLSAYGPAGYAVTGSAWQISNPITDVATIGWNSPVANCTPSTTNCDDQNSTDSRQIQITFTNPTSYGTTYLAGKTIMLVANLSNNLSWLCMAYPNASAFAADGTTLLSTLLPAGCHNAALDH